MRKKNIILASFSKHSGHYKAAQAIEKAYDRLNCGVRITHVDSSTYLNSFINSMVSNFYTGLVSNLPFIWGYLYDNKNVVKASRCLQDLSYSLTRKAEKILTQQSPDAIICTQAFTCGLFSYYKKKIKNVKVFAVITDHCVNSYWINNNVDGYFVPSEDVKKVIAKQGVDINKIFNVGLPVDPLFVQIKDKNSIKKKLNVSQNLPIILVMGGNRGIGKINGIIKKLVDVNFKAQLIVVCGRNKVLYKQLNDFKDRSALKNLLLFETFDKIDELMEIADILISKPGGITIAEAFYKDLPVISIGAISGQETRNQEYLKQKGTIMVAENIKQVVSIAEKIINKQVDVDMLKRNIYENRRCDSAINIANIIRDRI